MERVNNDENSDYKNSKFYKNILDEYRSKLNNKGMIANSRNSDLFKNVENNKKHDFPTFENQKKK